MKNDTLKGALERFEKSQAGTDRNREEAYEDMKFARLSDQWPDDVVKQRKAEGRPCLTVNKLPTYIRQVVNDARQAKPGIAVNPVDNGADPDTAGVIAGLVRSVERRSKASIAYDTAIDHAVSGGFGFFRIGIDYVSPDSFALEAKIHRIHNPLLVHWDVDSIEFDSSDWEYAFVSDFMGEDEFKTRFPKAEMRSFEGLAHDEAQKDWMVEERVRVAEYWQRETKKRTLLKLRGPNGFATIREDMLFRQAEALLGEMSEADRDAAIAFYMEQQGLAVVAEREAEYYDVTRRLITGSEVLEEESWPGSVIPICPVWGEEVVLDGRRHFRSLIRDAKDPQTMFNFWRTAATELVALAPRAPYLGKRGFVPEGEEEKWATANTRSHAYLEYEGDAMPQRQAFAGVPAGALQEALSASDDIKSVMGMFDAAVGARSNETSGKAIMARQREADTSTFHFIDNLNRAIEACGRILVEIIPSVYGAEEAVRILGEDEKEKVVKLTQQDGGSGDGEKLYNLSVGTYDVVVKSGPSFSTQREETRETLIEIMRQVPGAGEMIGDIVLEHMDFVGADKVAKRLKMLLPPQIQKAEAEEGMQGLPPEAQQMIGAAQGEAQQLKAQMQQMAEEMQKLQAEAQSKQQDMQAKMAETERKTAEAAAKIRQDEEAMRRDFDLRSRELDLRERESVLTSQTAIVKQLIASKDAEPDEAKEMAEEYAD
jgi:hypothetical protein